MLERFEYYISACEQLGAHRLLLDPSHDDLPRAHALLLPVEPLLHALEPAPGDERVGLGLERVCLERGRHKVVIDGPGDGGVLLERDVDGEDCESDGSVSGCGTAGARG